MIFEDLPKAVKERFEAHGVQGLHDCVRCDLLPDGTFGTVWIGLDDACLYILSGTETVPRKHKQDPKEFAFEETDFRLYPLESLGKCEVERYFSTARLVSTPEEGEPRELLRFTLSCADKVAHFARQIHRPRPR